MAIIRNIPSQRIINGKTITSSESAIVSDPTFVTKGEGIVIIKNIDSSKVTLDHTTTDHVTIKALTKVLILPIMGKIDDEYDEQEFLEKKLSIFNPICLVVSSNLLILV